MKSYATTIVDELERRIGKGNVEFFVWLSSCYGACDTPNVRDFDLVIQFGHSPWKG